MDSFEIGAVLIKFRFKIYKYKLSRKTKNLDRKIKRGNDIKSKS